MASLSIRLIEDEAIFARAAARALEKAGHRAEIAGTLHEARRGLVAETPDVVLLDIRLPDGNGLDLLAEIGRLEPDPPPVVVLSAYGEIEDAVAAMKQGAADYLRKPLDLDELLVVVERAAENAALRRRLRHARERESSALDDAVLLGESSVMQAVRERIRQIAAVPPGDDGALPNVLLSGETGTGKDLAARAIHRASSAATRPFVTIDCAALPSDMMEAELFGRAPGGDGDEVRTGLIDAAEDGTVFLDEIGELTVEMQGKLLNAIERRRVRRVGATREVAIRARFMAATNRDLEGMIADGAFRRDLFYRLNVLNLELPPLRAHRDDIPALAESFLRATTRRYGRPPTAFDQQAMRHLVDHAWPGNVRELKHLVERTVLLSSARTLTARDIPLAPVAAIAVMPDDLDLDLERMEKNHIAEALDRSGGNISRAAALLGLTRMALRYRMQKHGIGRPDDETADAS